jgi:hypothetical protein
MSIWKFLEEKAPKIVKSLRGHAYNRITVGVIGIGGATMISSPWWVEIFGLALNRDVDSRALWVGFGTVIVALIYNYLMSQLPRYPRPNESGERESAHDKHDIKIIEKPQDLSESYLNRIYTKLDAEYEVLGVDWSYLIRVADLFSEVENQVFNKKVDAKIKSLVVALYSFTGSLHDAKQTKGYCGTGLDGHSQRNSLDPSVSHTYRFEVMEEKVKSGRLFEAVLSEYREYRKVVKKELKV